MGALAGRTTPDAGTVFRIASMTKSFTAAWCWRYRTTVLAWMTGRGVRASCGLALPSPDSPRVSLQHLP
jgi:hypothetical protein